MNLDYRESLQEPWRGASENLLYVKHVRHEVAAASPLREVASRRGLRPLVEMCAAIVREVAQIAMALMSPYLA